MNLELTLAAGVTSGTVLLLAAIGEILTERAGVINLGVEGMMFVGAWPASGSASETGNPWLGILAALIAGGVLALLHAIVTIQFQADQIVSGLALTLPGDRRGAGAGRGVGRRERWALAAHDHPAAAVADPLHRARLLHRPVGAGLPRLPAGAAHVWYWINHTRPGLHLRAVGEQPTAADALGVNVYRCATSTRSLGGALAGLAGATITMVVGPGWNSDQTTSGRRAGSRVGLVIFAQW